MLDVKPALGPPSHDPVEPGAGFEIVTIGELENGHVIGVQGCLGVKVAPIAGFLQDAGQRRRTAFRSPRCTRPQRQRLWTVSSSQATPVIRFRKRPSAWSNHVQAFFHSPSMSSPMLLPG